MGVPGSANLLLLGGERGYQIERSLRFNSADSAYCSRVPASAGNRKTWTLSMWVKRSGSFGSFGGYFWSAGTWSSGNLNSGAYWSSADKIVWFNGTNAVSTDAQITTNQVFRDPSAWYHLVFRQDTTNGTSADRLRIYVNGVLASVTVDTTPTLNHDSAWNGTFAHNLGGNNSHGTYSNHYFTDINFIDGSSLDASSFGETDTITGVWKPKKYAGTYGTNGFYLKFADNSGTTSTTLGKDSSGNGNNWTPNNFSVTAGAGNDSMIDTPTPYADGGNGRGNYCTLNPLILIPRGTISNGNLNYLSGSTASHGSAAASFTLPTTGKWYWEVTACANSGGSGNNESIGVANIQNNPQLPASGSEVGSRSGDYAYRSNAARVSGGSSVSYGATYTNGDVIGVAWDSDAGTLVFYKNGSSQGTAYSSITQEAGKFAPASSNAESSNGDTFNFGQRSFSYTPPAGFLALNTQNLPEPSIKKPSQYFDALLWTGTNSTGTRTLTGLSFQPDLVWGKIRSSAFSHQLYDSVRGTGKSLITNSTAAEDTSNVSGYISAFNSDGFTATVGSTDNWYWNKLNDTYVAWCWDESATPGFDIVTYTGNGTSNRTIGHNLGVVPAFGVVKCRDTNSVSNEWRAQHKDLTSGNYIVLSSTSAQSAISGTSYGSLGTFSSSSTVTLQAGSIDSTTTNENGKQYVMYLWSEVAGFSKFGSYVGNNSTDGPFVYCGFRPRWVMIKDISTAQNWLLRDSARSPYNVMADDLWANLSLAESAANAIYVDFLSNGFKIRNNTGGGGGNNNNSPDTYIFAAFAESPFKYSLAR